DSWTSFITNIRIDVRSTVARIVNRDRSGISPVRAPAPGLKRRPLIEGRDDQWLNAGSGKGIRQHKGAALVWHKSCVAVPKSAVAVPEAVAVPAAHLRLRKWHCH